MPKVGEPIVNGRRLTKPKPTASTKSRVANPPRPACIACEDTRLNSRGGLCAACVNNGVVKHYNLPE